MAISNIWTLDNGTTEQTLDAWGIDEATLVRKSQAADVLTLTLPGTPFDQSSGVFAYQAPLTLRRYSGGFINGVTTPGTGTKWFVGLVTKTPRMGKPRAEQITYEVSGPWWYLDNIIYMQYWTVYEDDLVTTTASIQPRVILFANAAGALISTGAQIILALDYALTAFGTAPFSIGTDISSSITAIVPYEKGVSLTVAEVIKRALRWHPDAVTWWDYTTSTPTLHCNLRGALSSASFAVAGAPATGINIVERTDLQVSGVYINYETTARSNGLNLIQNGTDIYPSTPPMLGCLVLSIDLKGIQSTAVYQTVDVQAIDATSVDWWQKHHSALGNGLISGITVNTTGSTPPAPADPSVVSADGGTAQANELVGGEFCDWMNYAADPVLVSAYLSWTETPIDKSGNGQPSPVVNRLVTVQVMSVNIPTGTQTLFQTTSLATNYPAPSDLTGLAQLLYTALNVLQFEGEWKITEQDVGTAGGPYLGCVLNLTGGLTAWATMNAGIYETVEDLSRGETTLRFGPHKYLSAQDFIGIMRASRDRTILALDDRISGILTTGGQALSRRAVKSSLSVGPAPIPIVQILPSTGGSNYLTIDAGSMDQTSVQPDTTPGDHTAMWRKVQLGCDGSGNPLYAFVHCTNPVIAAHF